MAERKSRKRGNSFALGMLVYALIFIMALLIGLRVLADFLSAYEASQPRHTMDSYLQSFNDEHIDTIAQSFAATLDSEVLNTGNSRRAIAEVLAGELSYARKAAECNDTQQVYMLQANGHTVGRVVLVPSGEGRFGMSPWVVSEESFDFVWLLSSDSITVPDNWSVVVNGTRLDQSYVEKEGIEYRYLKDFYGNSLYSLPLKRTYKLENVVGEAGFEVYDQTGALVPVDADFNDDLFLNSTTTAEQRQRAQDFIPGFLEAYVRCLSNSNHAEYDNYNRFKKFVVAGSDIDLRVQGNIAGQHYAHSKGDEVTGITYNRFVDFGNGYLMADITYTLNTIGNQGQVSTVNNAQVILSQSGSGLLATELYTY